MTGILYRYRLLWIIYVQEYDCYSYPKRYAILEIIILTAGFEVLSLDRKDAPQTLPDLTAPHMAHLARRLDGTRALGMYRISEKEFLLCYDGIPPFSR